MKPIRVLLVIDSFDREYLAMRLLECALRSRGAEPRLCSRTVLEMTFNRFKPEVVVIPKAHKITGLEIIHRSSVVILAQAESFSGSKDAFLQHSMSMKKEFIDVVNCWGEFDRDFYVEHGLFSSDQTFVNGHPISESWYHKRNKFPNITNPSVGIAMSIRSLTHKAYGPKVNLVKCVIDIEDVGEGTYFLPPYHAEDRMAYEAAWVRVVYQLIKDNQDIHFVLRPHPLESPKHYETFTRFPNVRLNSGGHIHHWLSSIDVLCSAFSTTMLDAYFQEIPVISIKKLIPNRVLAGIPPALLGIPHDKYFFAPHTFSELRSQLHKPWNAIPELDALGKRVYNFPDKTRPSERLADTIVKCAPSLLKAKAKFESIPESRFERLCGPFSWAPDLRLAMLQWRDFMAGTNISSAAYGRHRFLQNRKYNDIFEKISNL